MASTSDTPSNPNNDGSPLDRLQTDVLESQIVAVLQTCYDPEIPVKPEIVVALPIFTL